MPAFTNVLVLLLGLVVAALGMSPFSNDAVTETPAPQELGAITADGGAAPTPATGAPAISEGGYDSDTAPAYTTEVPAASLTPVITSTDAQASPTTLSEAYPSELTDFVTQSDDQMQPTAPNDAPLPTSTGAAIAVGVHPGVAVGAGLAMAWML